MADENAEKSPKLPPKIHVTGKQEEEPAEAIPVPEEPAELKEFRPAPEDDLSDLAQTVRIELASQPPPTTRAEGVTEEEMKRTTARIEPAPGISPMSDADKMEAAKKSTVRVQIDEEKAKGDTARMDTSKIVFGPEEKKKTARIDLGEVLEGEEDIFKRRTALLDASKFGVTEAPGVPRTIRIKRPETPVTPAVTPSKPMAPAAAPGPELAKKSETARIELPPEISAEQPPTRRKTIRIKRPEGVTTSKPLVISKPEGPRPARQPVGEVEEVTPVFSGVAIAAIVVAAILVYVLAAQTIAPGLPFPGKL